MITQRWFELVSEPSAILKHIQWFWWCVKSYHAEIKNSLR